MRLKLMAPACITGQPGRDRRILTRGFASDRAQVMRRMRDGFVKAEPSASKRGVSLGKRHPLLHVAPACGGLRDHRERLSEARMVDLLGMFRRRSAKRGPAGFARSRVD